MSSSRLGSWPRLATRVDMSASRATASTARTIAAKKGSPTSGTAMPSTGTRPDLKTPAIGLAT